MDEAGVDRAVLVQPVGAYSCDNNYTADSAAAHPGRFVSACVTDPDTEHSEERLPYWLGERGMRGVRFFAVTDNDASLSDPLTLRQFGQAAALGAHIIVTTLENKLQELAALLGHYREVGVSLDHCGFCDVANPEPLLELARFENLHLKVTTITIDAAVALEGTARPFVGRLVNAYGAERLMWGSDCFQTHDRPYLELVRLGLDAFGGLSSTQQEACLGGTAQRLWFRVSRAS